MAENLTGQVRDIRDVTQAIVLGDLSKQVQVKVHGEMLELKDSINGMVHQLRIFTNEVTRVVEEVGEHGILGTQVNLYGLGGNWGALGKQVNRMVMTIATQVRGLANVTKAIASGDLTKKVTVEEQGEIAELKYIVNIMVSEIK